MLFPNDMSPKTLPFWRHFLVLFGAMVILGSKSFWPHGILSVIAGNIGALLWALVFAGLLYLFFTSRFKGKFWKIFIQASWVVAFLVIVDSLFDLNATAERLATRGEVQQQDRSAAPPAATPAEVRRQVAGSAVDRSLIANRYQVRGLDGDIIYDTVTGLEWQRCSVGQTWSASTQTCTGNALRFTWDDIRQLTLPGGFRVPTLEELRTLVYCSSGQPAYFKNADGTCSGDYKRPTIVQRAFPNIPAIASEAVPSLPPASNFWSASPHAGNPALAWGVSFSFGSDRWNFREHNRHVRLVRDAQ